MTSQAEILHELELEFRKEMQSLHHDLATAHTKIYTTLSVAGICVSVLAYALSLFIPTLTK